MHPCNKCVWQKRLEQLQVKRDRENHKCRSVNGMDSEMTWIRETNCPCVEAQEYAGPHDPNAISIDNPIATTDEIQEATIDDKIYDIMNEWCMEAGLPSFAIVSHMSEETLADTLRSNDTIRARLGLR